jgi:carbonic anhydrase
MADVIDLIRSRQNLINVPESEAPPVHKPEILLIGCVDARLSIHKDLGFPDGSALIYRNIAALVSGNTEGDWHDHVSEAAALEFAVNVMKVKHIVVMGHTDCGGIKASLTDVLDAKSPIREYLKPLTEVRDKVVEQGGDLKAQARAMEQAAVRNSVVNLLTYPTVSDAVREGRIEIHGWVINTGTKVISEMNSETGEFESMRKSQNDAHNDSDRKEKRKKAGGKFLARFLPSFSALPLWMEEASTVCMACL